MPRLRDQYPLTLAQSLALKHACEKGEIGPEFPDGRVARWPFSRQTIHALARRRLVTVDSGTSRAAPTDLGREMCAAIYPPPVNPLSGRSP